MSSITLNTYDNGDTNYVAKMNNDNSTLQTTINNLLTSIEGSGSPASLGTLLLALFGFSSSVIGNTSYSGTESGTNFLVGVGYAWKPSTVSLVQNQAVATLAFSGKGAGTYYITPDNTGNPTIQTIVQDALYEIVWSGTSFTSATLLSSVFMSAIDEGALLTSTTNATTYPTVVARFEAIEQAIRNVPNTIPKASTTVFGLCEVDGTTIVSTNGVLSATQQTLTHPYDIAVYVGGQFTANQSLAEVNVVRAFSWPTNLVGSVATLDTATTNLLTVSLLKNGTTVGTANFAAGSTTATFTIGAESFAVGDKVSILAPDTPDASAAGLSVTFLGTRS